MTPELFKKRIQSLEEEKAKLGAMIHVMDGAIQDCEYWLEQLKNSASGISMEDFRKMTGADSVEIVNVNKNE